MGKCPHSWSFCAQSGLKGHNNNWTPWGEKIATDGGEEVLGVALDMVSGIISYGLNGTWSTPVGVAFESINTKLHFFPAISGCNSKVSVNTGDEPVRFAGPDPSYLRLSELRYV